MKLTKLNSGEILECTKDEAETLLTILTETLQKNNPYGRYAEKGKYLTVNIVAEKLDGH